MPCALLWCEQKLAVTIYSLEHKAVCFAADSQHEGQSLAFESKPVFHPDPHSKSQSGKPGKYTSNHTVLWHLRGAPILALWQELSLR